MKLIRFGPAGQERPGAIDAQGRMRDLSLLVSDITPDWLSPAKLGALAAVDLLRMPLVPEGVRLGAPIAGTRQFLGIGLNYHKHAEEAGLAVPAEPVLFTKGLGSISGPNDDVVLPAGSETSDWEVELGVIIGAIVRKVDVRSALNHVAGYCLANDVSEREWQLNRSGQWCKGKSFESFGPLGPWLVTSDEISDPQDITLELKLNGEVTQRSSTADQIFSIAEIVSHLSQFMTLYPGDVIVTGTPSGVGAGMKPPRYLKRGDVMELSGGLLGQQRQHAI